MLDVNLLRKEPDRIAASLAHRGITGVDLDRLADLDQRRRAVRAEAETARAEQKELGGRVARLDGAEKAAAIARGSEIAAAYKARLAEADDLDRQFEAAWIPLPNLVHDSVPQGETEDDNAEIKRWGDIPEFDFPVKDHLELAAASGVIDMERAAKISGSRFGLLTGAAVLLEFALVRWVMERLGDEGFTPVVPPVLVREDALFGTGFFPDDDEQVYAIPADDLYLVGTSEVALASMHADEIFPAADLPRRYVGFSTCFRRESGAAGRDTRGIFRLHQFDKLEMFSFCHPDDSWTEHDYLFAREEALVQELGIPYRVVNVCSGDLGASAAKKYDIEAWFPGQERYREITSCSNTTDYQSRRLKIRVKDDHGNRLLHTLNGTAVAIQRTLVAIMENFQQADGTVRVPEALVPFAGFESF
ncbi:MAG: serine--tRNA ligase [Acidimicrobiia bacterium]|nr:serine--tRNA ligase [Acidimicrobiia bacterium]